MGFARRLASEGMEIDYTRAVTRKDLADLIASRIQFQG
jgi:hypothetical protein